MRDLAGSRYDSISVEGHTERLGASDCHQRLSLRRAEPVKRHLVRSGGLDASELQAAGMGEGSPTRKPSACDGGGRPSAARWNCLQSDRRVAIEVAATGQAQPGRAPVAAPSGRGRLA